MSIGVSGYDFFSWIFLSVHLSDRKQRTRLQRKLLTKSRRLVVEARGRSSCVAIIAPEVGLMEPSHLTSLYYLFLRRLYGNCKCCNWANLFCHVMSCEFQQMVSWDLCNLQTPAFLLQLSALPINRPWCFLFIENLSWVILYNALPVKRPCHNITPTLVWWCFQSWLFTPSSLVVQFGTHLIRNIAPAEFLMAFGMNFDYGNWTLRREYLDLGINGIRMWHLWKQRLGPVSPSKWIWIIWYDAIPLFQFQFQFQIHTFDDGERQGHSFPLTRM